MCLGLAGHLRLVNANLHRLALVDANPPGHVTQLANQLIQGFRHQPELHKPFAQLLAQLERLRTTLAIPMVYVSHGVEEVARLADHLVLLDGGRVVAQGPLQQTLARLDLPCALIETLGSVVEGRVAAVHHDDSLMELAFAGGVLWLPHADEVVGQSLRCRIDARNVVIARERAQASSAMNQIRCDIVAVVAADHPAQCLVQLDAGGARLLARITWHSWHALGLAPGDAVWAQVKAVALGG